MAAVEHWVTHNEHRFGVDSSVPGEVWLSWMVRHARVSSFLPAATARELAQALLAAADAAEAAEVAA